ncbi:MAG: polynucleotide adenylyltransferase [Puniceicoccales bacterium]|nr:polynucleotide adenylyltransferase [Puniceicoccales bacterium]
MNTTLTFQTFEKLTPGDIFEAVRWICSQLLTAGAKPYLVGGCVRDAILEIPLMEFDIEVFNASLESIEKLLAHKFTIESTGKSFCVLKIYDLPIDISVPRLETKSGPGHTNFKVNAIENCDVKTAASRRDFTINAIYFDVANERIIDEFGGIGDLQSGTLRHTSEKFPEDQLRVLRAMQFAGRFKLTAAKETLDLCQNLSVYNLSKERIFAEWEKLMLQSEMPSMGLQFLKDCGWIKFFPEIAALVPCVQDPKPHPEGSVFAHTCMALDVFAKTRTGSKTEDMIIGFATLCHDFGKPYVTTSDERGIHHYGHDEAGLKPAGSFLYSIGTPDHIVKAVLPLVRCHITPRLLYEHDRSDSGILHLANKVERIDRLLRLCYNDFTGRAGWEDRYDEEIEKYLENAAQRLGVFANKPIPIIQGRHLMQLGLLPSEKFSEILKHCFMAQLNCEFSDLQSGISYLQKLVQSNVKS